MVGAVVLVTLSRVVFQKRLAPERYDDGAMLGAEVG